MIAWWMSFIIFLLIFSWWTRYVQVWFWRYLLVHKLLFTTRELWFILLDPICKTYFYILIALVLKADILDCYIPRSFFLASLILSECFGSQKYLSAVLVLTFDTIHIQVYSETSSPISTKLGIKHPKVKGNQNCSIWGLIICTPTRTTVLQYLKFMHPYFG